MIEAARAIVVAVALLMGAPGGHWQPLDKWIEQRPATATDWYAPTFWVFETDFDIDLSCWVYREHQVTRWEWMEIEIVKADQDEEPG